MNFGDRFFKLKLKATDLKIKLKRLFSASERAASSAVKDTPSRLSRIPLDLKEWTSEKQKKSLRLMLFSLLTVLFYIAARSYAFIANDAFISFRYVANAVKGWGYTFNPPPFEPVGGYTSFLWLRILRFFWAFGIKPPLSAHFLTFAFSMEQIWLCFLFLKRASFPRKVQDKSLFLFLFICLFLLMNRTFLAFMTSGTEAALFNFLVLLWVYAITSQNDRPYLLTFSVCLLTLCRPEGFLFLPASAWFLFSFMSRGFSKTKGYILLFLLLLTGRYFTVLKENYDSVIPHFLYAFYYKLFPSSGWEYLLSFILEYALYFWVIVFLFWLRFKLVVREQKSFPYLLPLGITLLLYIAFLLIITGGDSLEYKTLSVFIPLALVSGVIMIAQMTSKRVSALFTILCLFGFFGTSIPLTHRIMTKDLNTRAQTTFLYTPITGKARWLSLFTNSWNKTQKQIIYQGVGLRHQEHKVLTEELLKTFPARKDGELIPLNAHRLFIWDFVGVAGWTLPNVYIIDLSGQNNKVVARSGFKSPNRRLLGHDRKTPDLYLQCFGGSNIHISPFAGKKNLSLSKNNSLDDKKIYACESIWNSQEKPSKKSQKTLY